MYKRVEARTSRPSSESCRHPSLLSLSWMGNLLCAPERRLPRASKTTQVSNTSLKLSWDEIQNLSQLLWQLCWGHTGFLAASSNPTSILCFRGLREAGFPVKSAPHSLSSPVTQHLSGHFFPSCWLAVPSRPLSTVGWGGQRGL